MSSRKTKSMLLGLMVLSTMLCILPACSSSASVPEPDPGQIVEEAPALANVPAGFTKGFERAEFSKFNSPAEENGLGGTPIYVEGVLEKPFVNSSESGNLIGALLGEESGGSWLISMDTTDDAANNPYENLWNHEVCIVGIYEGFSELYGAPTVFMNKVFDRETGNIVTSMSFGSYSGSSKNVSAVVTHDFNPKTNTTDKIMGASFQVPASWGERDENGMYVYYHPDEGILMIQSSELETSTGSFPRSAAEQYLNGVEQSGIEDYEFISLESAPLKSDGRDAWFAEYKGSVSGLNLTLRNLMFFTNEGMLSFIYADFPDSEYDRSEDFRAVLDSIVVDEVTPAESERTSEHDAENSKPAEAPKPADEMTMGQKNALSSAKSYLSFMSFSHSGLVEQLEYEGYSHEDAIYAADNCGADWNKQAEDSANSYLKYSAFSYSGLVEQLEYEGFTHDQAVHGVDSSGADWNEQAAKSAESYLSFMSFSRSELIEQLEYEGFTHEQAEYGVSANGY